MNHIPMKLACALCALALLAALLVPGAAQAQVGRNEPLSSMVAVTLVDDQDTGAENAADYVKALVEQYANGELPESVQFPLAAATTDGVRALSGFNHNVVISWLDPLTWDRSVEAPRFGANNDYIAYFGEGWQEEGGLSPYFKGSDDAGWVWVNYEYISGDAPTTTSAPVGQHMTFARFLQDMGVLTNDVTSEVWTQEDVDTYIRHYKEQLGGAWMRIVEDPATGEWSVDLSADNVRYDATSNTLTFVTGYEISEPDHSDFTGEALTETVVSGIMGDCSGGQTPWGTILTAEENVQGYYGDLEACWTGNNAFIPESGFDPGAPISPIFAASEASDFGQISDPNGKHNRDYYGFIVEMHPGADPADYYESVNNGGDGAGHRKIGAMGRARWENAAISVGADWELMDGEPIVIYGGNDRRSGRIYKLVTNEPYTAGMSVEEIRALLDTGTLYVAHFAGLDYDTGWTIDGEMPTEANPGQGRWIEMRVDSEDIAPNAEALGAPGTTVGEALQDVEWNNIGGFTSDNDVLMALFTAAMKIGVSELNRPEDIEYNPLDPSGTPRLYVAFTNHTRPVALNQDGVLFAPATHEAESPGREDSYGSIFAIEESNPSSPASSETFTYFGVWKGTGEGGLFDAAAPDNLMLDADGGVWFGTDGNFSRNNAADALYYLDLDSTHQDAANPTFGMAFRVVAGPSDSEATGPAFSADMGTIFFNVQHPGENVYSSWPQGR